MPSTSRALTQLGLAALAALALSASASAAPVVYTMQGTLVPRSQDLLSLAGATLMWVATADTGDTPTEVFLDDGSAQARYLAPAVVTFSNRPGGAPDLQLNYEADLLTFNRSSPEVAADSFALDPTVIRLEGHFAQLPGFDVDFQNQEFYPGNGVAPLPLFGPGDVASLAATGLEDADLFPSFSYAFTNLSITAVPEPASALLLASGLAALAIRRRAS